MLWNCLSCNIWEIKKKCNFVVFLNLVCENRSRTRPYCRIFGWVSGKVTLPASFAHECIVDSNLEKKFFCFVFVFLCPRILVIWGKPMNRLPWSACIMARLPARRTTLELPRKKWSELIIFYFHHQKERSDVVIQTWQRSIILTFVSFFPCQQDSCHFGSRSDGGRHRPSECWQRGAHNPEGHNRGRPGPRTTASVQRVSHQMHFFFHFNI